MNGYIAWPKDMDDTFAWYTVPKTAWLYQHLVTRACFRDSMFRSVRIPKGSLATSLNRLALETGLTEHEVRTAISNLVESGDITKKAVGHMTVVSITNYDRYLANEVRQTRFNSRTSSAPEAQHMNKENKDLNNIKNINNILDAWRDAGLAEKDTLKNKDLCEGLLRLLEDYGENSVLKAVANVAASDFLRGQPWFGLWWFVKPDNFQKVLNGKYANREAKPEVPAQAEKPHEMTWEESEAFRKKVMGD